jgi:hypothetical protein
MDELNSLAGYAGFLYGMKLDSEIMGTEFAYQKELGALEKWAHDECKKMDDAEGIDDTNN